MRGDSVRTSSTKIDRIIILRQVHFTQKKAHHIKEIDL